MALEYPKLGKHCAAAGCHQLDFLPFECKHCHRIFCLEHRESRTHQCEVDIEQQNVLPKCPLCNQVVMVRSGESADRKVDEHIASGCQRNTADLKGKKNKCGLPSCPNKENYALVKCKVCIQEFCLTHRLEMDHNCKGKPKEEAKSGGVGLKLLERLKLQKETREKEKTAAIAAGTAKPPPPAVQRLALKQRAQGDERVPEKDRFFLQVEFAPDVKRDSQGSSLWVDRNWTVGRAIDSICSLSDVVNRNNDKNAKQLVLHGRRMAEPLPFDIPLFLLDPQLISGDTVTLKYANQK